MTTKIEQINVKNLGPLNDFSCDLKQVNLFFGHNEHGKTYLVEFIYKSLFKNKSLSLRDFSAAGQVMVSGLDEKKSLFSPVCKKKLEDFWEDGLPGLPRDFSKLLVVKGADLDLSSGNSDGIDDKILKEFLSGEHLLEEIGKRIKATESSATYENGRISGPQKGMVKDYYEALVRIQQFDDAILQVNEIYSGGKRFKLNQKIIELKKQKAEQEQARRHLAFTLAEQLTDLRLQMDDLPTDVIADVDKQILTYRQKQTELEKKQQELKKNQEKTKDYLWLDSAVAEYQKIILAGKVIKSHFGSVWLVFSLIAAAMSILLVLIQQTYIGVGMILIAEVFNFIYLSILKRSLTNSVQMGEIERIIKDYKIRFGSSGVIQEATLVAKQKDLQPAYFAIEQLNKDIQTLANEIEKSEQQINLDLKKLRSTKTKKGEWEVVINGLQEKRKKLDDQFHQIDNKLSRLNINESEYLQDQTTVQYDSHLLQSVSDDLETSEEEIKETDSKLQELKQMVCSITREAITSRWENLIDVLMIKRQEEVNQYKEITAGILARIKVNEVLDDLRKVEEERIEEGLNSNTLSQAMLTTTSHYTRVEKEDGELFVADSFGRYRVSDLSTGAREQVLLGLRLGFASRILAGTPLFLILDDAFQHSDWDRREGLVKKLFALSKEGWQIIYFTMDDHIRKLFETNAKNSGKSQYQTILLP